MNLRMYKAARNLGLSKKDVDRIMSSNKAGTDHGNVGSSDVYKAGTRYGTVSSSDVYKAGTRYGTISPKDF